MLLVDSSGDRKRKREGGENGERERKRVGGESGDRERKGGDRSQQQAAGREGESQRGPRLLRAKSSSPHIDRVSTACAAAAGILGAVNGTASFTSKPIEHGQSTMLCLTLRLSA
jgi:hypothetical protein